ncbi:hypothetical protein KY319_05090 [Candidatus Woesearchaeota archaeon]|nr:hypothetical protein [Candidatus Woesearchaeota archaeon]
MTILNHHSASLLPYICLDDAVHLILEKKSFDYKVPFFDGALNFIGGNWLSEDNSPEDTVRREVLEEFWSLDEEYEPLNALLRQKFLPVEARVDVRLPSEIVGVFKELGPRLLKKFDYAGDFKVGVYSPVADPAIFYGASVFANHMSLEDYAHLKMLIEVFSGRLTTDNWKHGSSIVDVTLKEINEKNMKFAWGYDKIINSLLRSGKLKGSSSGVIRTLDLVDVKRLPVGFVDRTRSGVPTYAGLEQKYKYVGR